MFRYGVIYRISCLENDKCYIGRTKNTLRDRWYYHCRPSSGCLSLKRAIKKYGKESFTIQEIASSWDLENLRELEVLLIKQENTLSPNGYNLINTNKGPGEISEETRRKLKSHTGQTPWNKGIPMREESKQKLSEANKGHPGSWRGLTMSDEHKQKMSEAHIGQTPWNKDRIMTDEYRETRSRIARETFDPDHQRAMTEAARQINTGTPRSEETKKKIGDKQRGKPKPSHATSEGTKANISEALQSSEKFKASVEARIGRARKDNTSGHYGIVWDKTKNKWMVRVNKKFCGRFDNIENAIARRDEVLNANQKSTNL